MRAAIVHYHLNPGGVTRIIESQVKSLQAVREGIDVTVLCGDAPNSWSIPGTTLQTDNLLNYWNPAWLDSDFAGIVSRITEFLLRYTDDHTVLHCHNTSLGKNPALTVALYNLAISGYPVVNHCHDFPEQRPANMDILYKYVAGVSPGNLHDLLYPNLVTCHFITLNSTDRQYIVDRGIPASRVHLLPNPVSLAHQVEKADKPAVRKKICDILGFTPARVICTYPVRGIERKNLGEFILLAALFSNEAQFTITLAPKNPSEFPLYLEWKQFCHDQGINIAFESGEKVNHEELISISDFCLTTSTREGFGMVYLEPWLAGTPVVGRDIPFVTRDLKEHGVIFPRLYSAICVVWGNKKHDFKDLDRNDQKFLISEVVQGKSLRRQLFSNNPFLEDFLNDVPVSVILKNQNIVREEFSIEKYGKELLAIYREVS